MVNNITINNGNLEDVPRIIEFVVNWLLERGMEDHVFRVETALDEAVTNVFKHGYEGRGGYIKITCTLDHNMLELNITDRGKKFDPSSAPPPDLDSDLQSRRVGGLGIYMMKKMMDEIEYRDNADAGNELKLIKYIK
jgi:anti-sigma regulatory factor (Ser/Thr protein kinase)